MYIVRIRYAEVIERINSNIPVYLFDDLEDACVRIPSSDKEYVKFKGEEEFEAHKDSSIVFRAMMNGVTISEADYKRY